jgi:hypothetical protein
MIKAHQSDTALLLPCWQVLDTRVCQQHHSAGHPPASMFDWQPLLLLLHLLPWQILQLLVPLL